MTLADWDITKSHAGISAAIVGGRLRVDNAGYELSTSINILHGRLSSSYNRGFTQGKIRTKIEVRQDFESDSYTGQYGLLCMMSASDLTSTGSGYAFIMEVGASQTWKVVKYTSGIKEVTGVTVLDSGDTTVAPALDANFTMELQWAYDSLIGGTNLVCRLGLASNNFTDLQTIYDVTDSSTPLTTSVGEGFLYADTESTALIDYKRMLLDDTTIVPLTGTAII